MSGRAVRRALQRQREAELLANPNPDAESSSEAEDSAPPPAKPSLFALLGENDDDDDDEEEQQSAEEEDEPVAVPKAEVPTKSKNKKKKKKKGKKAAKKDEAMQDKNGEEEDDIDRALRQLQLESKGSATETPDDKGMKAQEASLAEVLKIDSRNLDAGNEMRRLFGRDALRGEAQEPDPRARQQGRGRGRGGPGGRALPVGRKNPFVQPKEDWPNASSGGLGMEVRVGSDTDEKLREHEREGEFTEYAFVHSRHYQDVQRQFMMCVESMDPQRMIQLLQHNPYHVTSLLQCSEIFHHQRDFNVSGDLLERALFTMGRSLHSTFSSNLASGKARLSFRRPENRELFLCGWRYIKNLAQRGTWRTAAEFAFLLLSLDPFGDPYEISLLLDFLCLKARQTSRLLDLLDHPSLRAKYFDRPNIAFSTAIAHHQLSNPAEAQEYLAKAITKFPWIPGMLSKELNLDLKLPGALWGVFPPDDNPRQQLYAQLYVERNKDLWKEPALTALLRETASTIHSLPRKAPLANSPTDISLSLARHIHLTESPGLIRLIPASITSTHRTHAFDPLIPDDNLPSYDPTPPRPSQPSSEDLARTLAGGNQNAVMAFLRTLLPWFDAAGVGSDDLPPMDPEDAERRETVEMFRRQLRNEGVDVEAMLEEVRRGTGLDPAQFADAIRAEVGEGLAAEAEDNEDDDAAAVRGNNGQENARE